jgi:mRNA-degrading endonuclease toxin of MazEF toxin-antitoxin module
MLIEQGDIISVEGISGSLLVVSTNFFNRTESIIACPIVRDTFTDPLHIRITTSDISGTVMCEQLKMLDLQIRGYKKISRISYSDLMNIADAIQSIFDY